MLLSDNTITQLYYKLELHLRNIDTAYRTAVPSNEFNYEIDRARYILDESRRLVCIAQALENKLRFAL